MPKPPFTALNVLGKRHKVKWEQDLDGDAGQFDCRPLQISVGTGFCIDEQRETVLHEAIHAVEYQLDLSFKEEQVRQLSVGVYQLLRANPEFVAWLLGEDDGD